jgi:hypothetical protein
MKFPRPSAASPLSEARNPVETGTPNRSVRISAARATGMWWRTIRYSPAARTAGPKQAGAVASAGKSALVSVPHSQRRRSATCSVTSARRSGRSNTCLDSRPEMGASPRPAPQHPYADGEWTTVRSGWATRARWAPGPPGCFPCRRPDFVRLDCRFAVCAARASASSRDGGNDEFPEFRPWRCSSSAIRASRRSTRERSSTFSAESLAFSAVRVAFSATRRAHSASSSSLRSAPATPTF